ncbi:MAG: erythromycin esterase family protein [Crocinitomicaceae bacterium]|nr:erythromycin esterase family protein [Flavobacteriales bacterium]NQZ35322.1 erythromycin esterase family protein [Crocinitomicaceae bacterium]
MKKTILLAVLILIYSCGSHINSQQKIEYTSDLKEFTDLAPLKETLKDVTIISLGENTHGMGEVFKTKVELVKYLHQELGFDLVLFESGYGDGALTWANRDSLSARQLMSSFSSNYYYNCEELFSLFSYVKQRSETKRPLMIQGIDCQPQQSFLAQKITDLTISIDTVFSSAVQQNFQDFNRLYKYEQNKDTIGFNNQAEQFISFLDACDQILTKNKGQIINAGFLENEIISIHKTIEIFRATYSSLQIGDIMSFPNSYNLRDQSMFNTVEWFKEKYPNKKIIIWAQNSHVENKSNSSSVKWMGHYLKEKYGAKYYSVGAIVYSGRDLRYDGAIEFEHNSPDYLAYHLNKFQREVYLLNLRNYKTNDFIKEEHLGMESGGSVGSFNAYDRFDGLLFIKKTNIPTFIKK